MIRRFPFLPPQTALPPTLSAPCLFGSFFPRHFVIRRRRKNVRRPFFPYAPRRWRHFRPLPEREKMQGCVKKNVYPRRRFEHFWKISCFMLDFFFLGNLSFSNGLIAQLERWAHNPRWGDVFFKSPPRRPFANSAHDPSRAGLGGLPKKDRAGPVWGRGGSFEFLAHFGPKGGGGGFPG